MKKRWVYVLSMLLVISLTAFGAAAEMERIQDVSLGEDALDIIPEEINISDDALDILDDTLDVEIPEDEELQLEGSEMLELVDPDVTEDAVLVDNEEEQIAPLTEEPIMSDTSDFEIDENGVLVKYNGPGGDVVIPDGVTSIGEMAFCKCTTLKSVIFPSSVVSIADWDDWGSVFGGAFQGCTGLVSVILNEGIQTIGDYAFSDCSNLININLPDSVTDIGAGAFSDCSNLKNINLPDSVTDIGASAFQGCGFSSVELPYRIINIDNGAFKNCKSLTSISIPDGVTDIGQWAFAYSGLTSITIPDSVTNIDGCAFSDCASLTTVVLPDSLVKISGGLFADCTSLESITIPDNVTSIDSNAFYGCNSLKEIILPSGLKTLSWGVFAYCKNLKTISIPDSITSIHPYVFNDYYAGDESKGNYIETVSIYKDTGKIKKHLFEKLNAPKVILEEGITEIDEYAFYGTTNLKSVSLPTTLITIGEGAFEQCGITEITIPRNVKKLGVAAFFDCRQLKTITFDSRLTAVGREAFFGCRKLTTIIISENMTDICDGMFKECEGITKIDIPETVGIIGNSAFESCSGLTSAIIGSAVNGGSSNGLASNAARAKKIVVGTKAFLGCGNMKKIVILANVTKIADDAFDGCLRLTIYGEKGSYAQQYAKEHDIPFKAVKLNTPPTGIAIDQGKKTTLYMGNKLKLTAKIEPAGATTTVTWKSSKPKVAAVSSKGVVTPKKAGTTVITARTANGLTKRITVKVVDASGVKLKEGKSRTLKVGKKLTLHAVVSPAKVKTRYTWKSSNAKIATVTSKGVVTAKKAGTATITVKTANGKMASIKITVK